MKFRKKNLKLINQLKPTQHALKLIWTIAGWILHSEYKLCNDS